MKISNFKTLRDLTGPVLITGHTGFKGTWMTLLLEHIGFNVIGYSLKPEKDSLFNLAKRTGKIEEVFEDIRDRKKLEKFIKKHKPSLVYHLAAQPLVIDSYSNPYETFEINSIGTANILDIALSIDSIKFIGVVTTDKVYENKELGNRFKESDALAGSDPYSESKVAAEAAVRTWQRISNLENGPKIVSLRAGNVIGGGDVSQDRLIPDLINGFIRQKPVLIRYPSAVRPWQHVLDCLNGYLTLVDKMLNNKVTGEWNFGPDERSFKDVKTVADYLKNRWGQGASWTTDEKENPHEAELLALDATKAETQLNWHNKLSFEETLDWTLDWHKAVEAGVNTLEQTQVQINKFGEMN